MPYPTPPPEPTPPPIVQTVQVPSTSASDLGQGQLVPWGEQRSPQVLEPESGAGTREYSTVHFPEPDTLSVVFTPAAHSAPGSLWTVGRTVERSPLATLAAAEAPANLETAATPNRSTANRGGENIAAATAAPLTVGQITEPERETSPRDAVPDDAPEDGNPNNIDAAGEESTPPTADGADESAEDLPTSPRGARPEPFWHNGALLNEGTLLTPSQPTTRPPTPLRLTADYQDYDTVNQVLSARGNVVLRVGNAVLSADRLWANLLNRYVRVEGNVVYTRGGQTVEAESGEYNLLQGQGSLYQARGALFLPGVESDFGDVIPTDPAASPTPTELIRRGPIGEVRGTGGVIFGTAADDTTLANPAAGATDEGFVRRIRFEAEQLDFDAEGWYAQDIRLTNDPFSPPELEFRGDTATFTRLTEFEDELYIENARVVFDQAFSIPLIRSRILLQRGGSDEVNPFFVGIGYDGEDRDGLFIERTFRVTGTDPWRLDLTPQLLVQRFTSNDEGDFFSNLGLEADLTGRIGESIGIKANASFSGLDLENLENRLRASVRAQQLIGTHTLNLEYSYRDRLFNGSLGFQDVQSSLGAVILSPNIVLGETGIVLNYQASAQYVTADTDRPDLLDPLESIDLVSLGRFQGSVGLSRGFTLWRGEPLPATPDAGLRFTSYQVVPNLQLVLSGRGTFTYYTSDDTQESLSASVALVGEFGHFSRDFLDSTVFNISYRRSLVGDGTSPFFFDRDVDQNVLSGGILQQIYGPFRIGFQTAINLDTGEVINTDYILEYSRRTYGIVVRYNPTQSSGFIGFRLNEFDWSGRAARFGGANIRQVEDGVIQ